ncbi:MAG: DUF3012 domain-containing protein [Candidatus Sedimenticola sp. 20ELBAFRAG]
MRSIKAVFLWAVLGSLVFSLIACTTRVGSDQWCQEMSQVAETEWRAVEAANFSRYCIKQQRGKQWTQLLY